MENRLREGISAVIEKVVAEAETASKVGSGSIDVYATPAMIALMENTAKSAVDLHLTYGDTTVGIEINVKHIRATPVGSRVRCEAVVERVEGKRITFSIRTWDEKGLIGEGTHIRYMVNIKKFMSKL